MKLLSSVADLSVRKKISAGFASVLLILMATSATGYVQIGAVAAGFDNVARRVFVANVSQDIERTFLDLRRHVREFALTGTAEDADATVAVANQVSASIDHGLTEFRDPDRHRAMLLLQARFGAYRAGTERVLQLKRELDALTVGELDRTGAEARQTADTLIDSLRQAGAAEPLASAHTAIEALMDLRLAANKMLGRHDPSLANAADRSASTLADSTTRLLALTRDTEQQADVTRLQAKATAYVAAVHRARDLAAQLSAIINGDMARDADLIATTSRSVVARALAEEHALADETHGLIAKTHLLLMLLALGGLATGLLAAMLIGRAIARPIARMSGAMRGLAGGDLDAEIPAQGRHDELGQMAEALLVLRQSAREERRMRNAEAGEAAAKERRQSAMDRHTQDFGATISGVMLRLVHSADSMRDAASSTSAASDRTRESAAETAAGASESSRNLSSISAATEQMSASIGGITNQVREAAHDTTVAAEKAAATDAKVAVLARAAEKINNVVQIIMNIAGQTNLLALNATIEAARAGEAGKGFAVVATAVKTLAHQTAAATTEIESELGAIRSATADAVAAVQDMSTAITRVNAAAREIAVAVEQQGLATHEIASSVQAVNATTQNTSASMQEVSTIAENAGIATREVKDTADAISQIATTLHQEVDHFLQSMSACTEQNRRRYERRTVEGMRVTLEAPTLGTVQATVLDISRGGAAFTCTWDSPPGTDVAVRFDDLPTALQCRVVRCYDGKVAIAFPQNTAALHLVDTILGRLEASAA